MKHAEITDEQDTSISRWVIVCSAKYTRVEGRPVNAARMIFDDEGGYAFDVLYKKFRSGSWRESQPPHTEIRELLDTLLANSGFVMCPGIHDFKEQYEMTVRFQSKHLRVWNHPHSLHDSYECLLWHKPGNIRTAVDSPLYNVCSGCKSLRVELDAIKRLGVL